MRQVFTSFLVSSIEGLGKRRRGGEEVREKRVHLHSIDMVDLVSIVSGFEVGVDISVELANGFLLAGVNCEFERFLDVH